MTDVLQFITFTINNIIPYLTWFVFDKTGNSVVEIVLFLQMQEEFQFSSFFNLDIKSLGM